MRKLESYFGSPKNISETIILDNADLKTSFVIRLSEIPKCGPQEGSKIFLAEVIGGSVTGKYTNNLKEKFNT